MITRMADNIYSTLGKTSEANYLAVKRGESGLRNHGRLYGVEQPVVASLIDWKTVEEDFAKLCPNHDNYTRFEKLLILSIAGAIEGCDIDVASNDTLFIISSTKGNIEHLSDSHFNTEMGLSARKVTQYFSNNNTPIVVSNACISGVNAQITAMRLLKSGLYRHAVVAGCDVQSKFIISGFQSFKALSDEPCRPFDKERKGLNLGEAAATIIYSNCNESGWHLLAGAIRNDANHISGPSRTGEGCYRALTAITKGYDTERIGLVNVHGTATLYNDEMESIALARATLSQKPVNALKGFFGHTMGAAGILETILSMHALDDHTIIGTKGYEQCGVSNELNISAENRSSDKQAFIKMLSGFGGCNAAILMEKGGKQ